MRTGKTLTELAQEIERRRDSKKDFIAPASLLSMNVAETRPVVKVGTDSFPIAHHAHDQIAEYAGIPLPYYRRMLAEAPELLASNFNRWMADEAAAGSRRMVRTLDGNVRAMLSDKYRPLENEDLAEAVLPVLLERDLLIMSCEITDTRLYIKAVDSRIALDVPTGKKMGDGSHVFFDTVSPAITIANSEVGRGALSIEAGIFTKVCTNLATFGASMRKYHTGARADISDSVYELLTDKTKRLTDAAVWSQTRDLVAAAFDRARFESLTAKLGEAASDRIERGADVVQVVEVVGKRFAATEGERKGILAHLIESGDLTRYGVHSAITRFSQDVTDYDRATELEKMGARVIELPRSEWATIAKAA